MSNTVEQQIAALKEDNEQLRRVLHIIADLARKSAAKADALAKLYERQP